MKFLEIMKKWDRAVVTENKKLKKIYESLLKEAEDEELTKEAEEDVEETCCKEAEDDKVDEAEDEEEVKEAGVSAEEFF